MPKYEAQEILAKETVNEKLYYLVQWLGYSKQKSTWEPVENLGRFKTMIRRFEKNSAGQSVDCQPGITKFLKLKDKRQQNNAIESTGLSPSSSKEILPNNDTVTKIFQNQKISSHQVAHDRIDNIMRQFKDEFDILFNLLQKKLKKDLTSLNVVSNVDQTILSDEQDNLCLFNKQFTKQNKNKQTDNQDKDQNIDKDKEIDKDIQIYESRERSSHQDQDYKQIQGKDIGRIKSKPQKRGKSDVSEQQQSRVKSQISRENYLTRKNLLEPLNILGTFEQGNQVEVIERGIEDQKDGTRKYLVKWKQNDSQEFVNDSWVQEQVMMDYACKDLAKFFLSKMKWNN